MHAIEHLECKKIGRLAEKCLEASPGIAEFGVSRDYGSTKILGDLARKTRSRLVLCDPSRSAIEALKGCSEYSDLLVETYCKKGEDLDYDYSNIGVFHVDGFDVVTAHMTYAKYFRKRKYDAMVRNYADAGIDIIRDGNALSSFSHLLICQRIQRSDSQKNRLILIDDTWLQGGVWRGKGASAVPFLISKGYYLVTEAKPNLLHPLKYKWGVGLYRPSFSSL